MLRVDTIGCFEYMAHLDFETMEDSGVFDEWPEIDFFTGAVDVTFIDCDTGADLATSLGTQDYDPTFEAGSSTLTLSGLATVCVKLDYTCLLYTSPSPRDRG